MHTNSVNPHIRFTQELNHDNDIAFLAFLDCHVYVNTGGGLATKVYRKPTHTDHYLRFDSHQTQEWRILRTFSKNMA